MELRALEQSRNSYCAWLLNAETGVEELTGVDGIDDRTENQNWFRLTQMIHKPLRKAMSHQGLPSSSRFAEAETCFLLSECSLNSCCIQTQSLEIRTYIFPDDRA